jgi:hypothetical protein
VKELGAQLVHMQIEHAKPSEKLEIQRPAMTAPPTTPTASSKTTSHAGTPTMTPSASYSSSSSKAFCSKTPGTHGTPTIHLSTLIGYKYVNSNMYQKYIFMYYAFL